MSDFDFDELTRPSGIVPVDTKTTAALVREVVRLRAAIRWALGEEADDSGCWFGETVEEHTKPYGWRKNLRRLAGLTTYAYDKEKRTIVAHQQSKESA